MNGSGDQKLVVEQVSHHPPITAYHIENESKGLSLQGHNAQKTSFSAGAIIGADHVTADVIIIVTWTKPTFETVKQIGHAILTLNNPNETYLITLPRLRIDGTCTVAKLLRPNLT